MNSAGCGALLKDYGHLLGTIRRRACHARCGTCPSSSPRGPAGGRPAAASTWPTTRPATSSTRSGSKQAPLAVLAAIPELRLGSSPVHDQCCGSAGIYSVLHPAMARAVLDRKITELAEASPGPGSSLTGNPGCLMQIGAGLRAAALPIGVAHPVELLDWSYQAGGIYSSGYISSCLPPPRST